MKGVFITSLVALLLGVSSGASDVTCSQIDFLYYDSQCCDTTNSVTCLKQLNKLEYDSTIARLDDRIDKVLAGDMTISEGAKLVVEGKSSIDVHSDSALLSSSVNILKDSILALKAGSKLDLSEIAFKAGETKDNRAVIAHVELSDVSGKDDKITMDDKLHADKGIVVDGDRFVVHDVTGQVDTKAGVSAIGKVSAGMLDINDKFKVGSNGLVSSKGSVSVENSLKVVDGVEVKFEAKKDGSVDVDGVVSAKSFEASQSSKLDGGLTVGTALKIDTNGKLSGSSDVAITGTMTLGDPTKTHTVVGTTVIPKESTLLVKGTLDVTAGKLLHTVSLNVQNASIDSITDDLDMKNNELKNVVIKSGATFDGPIGDNTPSTVKATILSASTSASLQALTATGAATISGMAFDDGKISNVTEVKTTKLVVVDGADVGGDVKLAKSVTVEGATVLKGTQTDALTVKQGVTVDQASLLRGDVTMEKSVTVKEKMEVGTSSTRKGLNVTVQSSSAALIEQTGVNQCTTNTVAIAASTPATALPILQTILAQGGACKDNNNIFVASKTTQALCVSPNTWFAVSSISNVAMGDTYTQICSEAPTSGGTDTIYSFGTVSGDASKKCKTVFAKKATSGRSGPEEFVSMIFARGGACLNATDSLIHPLAETEDACPVGYAWRPTGTPNTPPTLVAVKSDDSEAQLCVGDQVEDDSDFMLYNMKDVSGGAVHFEKDGTLRTSGKATLASVRVEGTTEVHDLRASGVVHITSLQQSDKNQFSVSKNGDLVAEKVTAGGDVAISGDVTLAKGLDVVGEAKLQSSVKVISTNHSNAAMVTLSNDGTVEAKKVVVEGVIEQKGLGFSVSDDGVVSAKRVDVSGRIMPFFQEQKAVSCTAKDGSLLDGPVIFAKGTCEIAFREWTCSHGAFIDGQQNGFNTMGSCVDTNGIAGNINYELKASCTPSTTIYCEALDSRSQCEYGKPYLPRTPDAVTRCASSSESSCGGIIASVLNTDLKKWSSDGTIGLKYCMKGEEQVPASSD